MNLQPLARLHAFYASRPSRSYYVHVFHNIVLPCTKSLRVSFFFRTVQSEVRRLFLLRLYLIIYKQARGDRARTSVELKGLPASIVCPTERAGRSFATRLDNESRQYACTVSFFRRRGLRVLGLLGNCCCNREAGHLQNCRSFFNVHF